MAKPQVEVGQTLYVTWSSYASRVSNLSEYKVIKVNTSSIYIKHERDAYEIRLDKRTLASETIGFNKYQAYISPDDYWIPIQRRNEKAELLKELSALLSKKDNEQLQEIKNYIMEA